jgi:MarR family transcriptional regulator, organic hydroperoxide resistance regulator
MAPKTDARSLVAERLSTLPRNLMRRYAAASNVQAVHLEVLQYLSICNRYSDTTQAIAEYLGLTKGSISQSLAHLEAKALITRKQDELDKRVFHLSLTPIGWAFINDMNQALHLTVASADEPLLESVLRSLQKQNGLTGFGICQTCRFNQNPSQNVFVCGLTNEKLKRPEIDKICREHQASVP